MAFVKRHFLWILVALALVAEGGLTFVLMGKQADANAKRKTFEQKQRELLRYQKDPPGRPEVLQTLAQRQEAIKRELTDCLLFLWHKGRILEPLFADERLQEANVKPWTRRTELDMDFGVFKLLYQNVYDAEVEKLAPRMEALHIAREDLGLAPANFFTLTGITIGDIFAAQKKFWILKEVVDICAEAGIPNLAQVQVLPGAPAERAEGAGAEQGEGAALYEPIALRLVVRCPYPKLSGVLDGLHASEMGFRLVSVRSIERAEGLVTKSGAGGAQLPAPRLRQERRGPRLPAGGPSRELSAEGGGAAARVAPPPGPRPPSPRREPPVPEARRTVPPGERKEAEPPPQLVQAVIDAEVCDFQLDIHQVTFSGAGFGSTEKVRGWLTDQIAAAEAILAQSKDGQRPTWVRDALGKLPRPEAGPGQPPEGEKKKQEAAEKTEKTAPTLVAYPGRTFEREYKVTDRDLAQRWLQNASEYWIARVEAVKALCQRTLQGLDREAASGQGGVTVTFRPREHFDESKFYDQQLTMDLRKSGSEAQSARPRTMGIKFGVLKFSPRLSRQGQNLWQGESF